MTVQPLGQQQQPSGLQNLTDPSAIRQLEELSVPFAFYSQKQPKQLGVWLATTPPSGFISTPEKKVTLSFDELKKEQEEREHDTGMAIIVDARRRAHESAIRKAKEQQVRLGPFETPFSLESEKNGSARYRRDGPAMTINAEEKRRKEIALHFWGELRERFSCNMDLEAQFRILRRRKLNGRPATFLLLPLPHPHICGAILPLCVSLKVVSGSRWVIFSDFNGSTFHDIIRQRGVTTSTASTFPVPVNRRQPDLDESQTKDDSTTKSVVSQLYIRCQYDSQAIAELAIFVKYNRLGLDELVAIWHFGSRSAQRSVRAAVHRECGVNLKALNREMRKKSAEEEKNASGSSFRQMSNMVIVDQGHRYNSVGPGRNAPGFRTTVPTSTNWEDPRRQPQPNHIDSVDDTIVMNELPSREWGAEDSKKIVNGADLNETAAWKGAVNISLHVGGVGIGLHSSKPSEILYASFSRIALKVSLRKEEVKMKMSLGWVQIDDPSSTAHYPTVVRPITESFVVRKSNTNVASHLDDDDEHVESHLRAIKAKQKKDDPIWNDAQIPGSFFPNLIQPSLRPFGISDNFEIFRLAVEMKIRLAEESDRGLLELPMLSVQLSPLSLNVDVELVKSILLLTDEFMSLYDVDQFIQDQHEIVEAEQNSKSDAWRRLQGQIK